MSGMHPFTSTSASSRGMRATSAGCMRSRSEMPRFTVRVQPAPRESLCVSLATVCLPAILLISSLVSFAFPPR